MKTIKGFSALMLAAAFMFSTAAFAAPHKAVVKQQTKTEKKVVAKKETKSTVKTEKKSTKKVAAKKPAKKASKAVAPASK